MRLLRTMTQPIADAAVLFICGTLAMTVGARRWLHRYDNAPAMIAALREAVDLRYWANPDHQQDGLPDWLRDEP